MSVLVMMAANSVLDLVNNVRHDAKKYWELK